MDNDPVSSVYAGVPTSPPDDPETGAQGAAKRQFLDDLVAADRFKTYLISRAVALPMDVSEGLAGLAARFDSDITRFIDDIRDDEAHSWWRALFPWRKRAPAYGEDGQA